jgi:branched-chain amino acid transport system substrate-binding protein
MRRLAVATVVWKPLHDAGIPLFVYGTTEASALLDKDSTFVLGDQITPLVGMPIQVAKDNKLKKVTAVVIDVPVATGFYETVGKQQFKDAGLDFSLVKVPPGTADMSPQIAQITRGGPTEVHILGNDSFCIAAFNGLRSANFTGPISIFNSCVSKSFTKAVGSYLKGVSEGTAMALTDPDNKDVARWKAIVATYAAGKIDPARPLGAEMYIVLTVLRQALDGISGDLTAATITAKIKSAPAKPYPMAPGLSVQCNGKAYPLTPASCAKGILVTALDDKGEPTLPYRALGASGTVG